MQRRKLFYIGTLLLGVCLLFAALLLYFSRGEELKAIVGVCLGIGAGISMMSIANLLMKRMERKYPERRKQTEIEYSDERNTLIRFKAKAKSADILRWCVMAIAYITILAGTDLWVTMVVVGVFMLHSLLILFFTDKYQKEF